MKLEELRIGNLYIGYDDKIQEIDLQFFSNLFNDVEIDEMIKEPIPLTEEWLIKLGFVSDGNERQFLFQLPDWIQEKCKPDNGFKKSAFFFNKREDINSWMDCQTRKTVKYVHQLQNLIFALTEEELTISE